MAENMRIFRIKTGEIHRQKNATILANFVHVNTEKVVPVPLKHVSWNKIRIKLLSKC